MTAGSILEVRDLTVSYGELVAVDRVSFTVGKGECLGIVGANGAGKSTLLRAIAGMMKMRLGSVHFCGKQISGRSSWVVARRGLSLVPEGRGLFGTLTVDDHLRLAARMISKRSTRAEAVAKVFDLFPALEQLRNRRARVLSGGEQQMLAVSRAMVAEPLLLVLDEPTLGLAPTIVASLTRSLRKIAESGTSILIAEQGLKLPQELCGRVLVCAHGRFVAEGPAATVLTDEVVRRAFLGDQPAQDNLELL